MSRHDLSNSPALIKFYRGDGTDFQGRYLKDMMKWDMRKLEQDHAYIQTMFPLPEPSMIVGGSAPKIDYEVFKAFRKSPNLRRALYDSFSRILWFYGLRPKLNEEGHFETVEKNPDSWSNSTRSWNTQFDHNHLRITRIIRCLRVLGLEEEAQGFYEFLKENAARASKTSHMYWTRAAKRPLNVKPDLNIDEGSYHIVGDTFLKAYDKRLKEAGEKDKQYGKGNWTKTEEEEAEDEENWSQSEDEGLI
ncbi:Opioid growth factor receptor [Lachnellula hyalina]|uniref:Opioid growth factor receptor n=1 Tax=Lachnellula hyalina TaxID=1316788 RepID=A0A8H8R2W0_9HELO|nr:Opioid growth factor receptor [Lachnellula hyalina]TVY26475.1 Opioid growth factor receptor [Lachnellula hyalina]